MKEAQRAGVGVLPGDPGQRQGGELPWWQGVAASCGCTATGSSFQSVGAKRARCLHGLGWSAGKNEPVQGLSQV